MSDKYQIDGVDVNPLGGGHYELTHFSLTEPEKVRGKEEADNRAAEIAKAAAPADGSITPQGGLPPAPPAPPSDDEKDKALEEMKAKLAELQKSNDEKDAEIEKIRTVVSDGGETPAPDNRVPNSVPREFRGEMDAKTKKMLKDMGMGVTTIILEENDDIPPTGLFLGHNGRGYMILPGEKVDVPEFLLNVLNDAVTSSPIVDSKSQRVLGYRDRMKYPYREVK
jgi:hypothetical protein